MNRIVWVCPVEIAFSWAIVSWSRMPAEACLRSWLVLKVLIAGITNASTMPMTATTTIISSSVNPFSCVCFIGQGLH